MFPVNSSRPKYGQVKFEHHWFPHSSVWWLFYILEKMNWFSLKSSFNRFATWRNLSIHLIIHESVKTLIKIFSIRDLIDKNIIHDWTGKMEYTKYYHLPCVKPYHAYLLNIHIFYRTPDNYKIPSTDMRVYLCCPGAPVPQQFLYISYIQTTLMQMRGITVP
jgi:hypothetical protein